MTEQRSMFIREGATGCVFTPPLPCSKSRRSKSPTVRTVGKIIKKKNATNEIQISDIIRKIPGHERYFIVQTIDNCVAKNFTRMRKKYESECKIYSKSKNTELIQLLSPYAGTSLHDIVIQDSFNFIENLRHVLEGIEILNSHGICHYDLHDNNILVDSRGTLRIIDLGSAFLPEHVQKDTMWKYTYAFDPKYYQQPPELTVQNGLHDKLPLNYSIYHTIDNKNIMKLADNILGLDINVQEKDLYDFWTQSDVLDDPTFVSMFHKYWKVWDSWGVGTLFLPILKKCFLLPSFVERWREDGGRIRNVLKGLLMADPRKRLTATAALKLLNA